MNTHMYRMYIYTLLARDKLQCIIFAIQFTIIYFTAG